MRGMQVLVYSAVWCRDCREAKRFLEEHQIPYTEIDIELVPGAADEVMRHVGKRAIPQFVIDGRWVQPYRPGFGFLRQEMSESLQSNADALCEGSTKSSSTCACSGKRKSGRNAERIAIGMTMPRVHEDIS